MKHDVLGYRSSPVSISITFDDGNPTIISNDHPAFVEISCKLSRRDFEGLYDLVNPAQKVRTFLNNRVVVTNNTIILNGDVVEGEVVPVILSMIERKEDPEVLLQFLALLAHNPSFRSRKQLWNFVEQNGIVLYSGPPVEGCDLKGWLVLYKGVNQDYTDCHTGQIDNHPGQWPRPMSRSQVDDDPNASCSTGYHAGAYEYVKDFGSRKLVVLINPANVVSVPRDSNAQKVRVTSYYVLKEVEGEQFREIEEDVYDDYN